MKFGNFVPYFLSAVLFLSGLFSFFAPIPLLLLGLKSGTKPFIVAQVTNLLLVFAFRQLSASFSIYLVYGLVLTTALYATFVLYKQTLGKTILLSTLVTMLVGGAIFYFSLSVEKMSILPFLDQQMTMVYEQFKSDWPMELNEFKKVVEAEMPFGYFLTCVLITWANLVLISRVGQPLLRKKKIPLPQWKTWRNPDELIWFGIVFTALWLWGKNEKLEWVSFNALKVLMVAYGFQGLSILVASLDFLKIGQLWRGLIYMLVIFFAPPFLVGIGVLDLWFDFRKKFRQSFERKEG